MKTRQGFVSNSSSSSFVVIGRKVGLNQVNLDSGKTYLAIGTEINEGVDVFEITKELLPWLTLVDYDFTIFDVVDKVYDTGKITLDSGTYDVEAVEADYYHTVSVDDLLDTYRVNKKRMINLVNEGKISLEDFVERISNEDQKLFR